MCFGVALSGTVFQNLLATYLTEYNLPVKIAQNAESYVIELKTMAVTESFGKPWYKPMPRDFETFLSFWRS
jgi:hypothetical protein